MKAKASQRQNQNDSFFLFLLRSPRDAVSAFEGGEQRSPGVGA